jgi:hypothetical protein
MCIYIYIHTHTHTHTQFVRSHVSSTTYTYSSRLVQLWGLTNYFHTYIYILFWVLSIMYSIFEEGQEWPICSLCWRHQIQFVVFEDVRLSVIRFIALPRTKNSPFQRPTSWCGVERESSIEWESEVYWVREWAVLSERVISAEWESEQYWVREWSVLSERLSSTEWESELYW